MTLAACSTPQATPPPTVRASPSPTTTATGLAHFSQDELGFGFDYPEAWSYEPTQYIAPSGYQLLGYLGTMPVDPSQICHTTAAVSTCDPHAYGLPPGNVVITISNNSGPTTDPIASFERSGLGTPTRVGGMAAVFSDDQQAADRVFLTWKIASPVASNNWIQLDADIRGPGLDIVRTQIEALIASFRFQA